MYNWIQTFDPDVFRVHCLFSTITILSHFLRWCKAIKRYFYRPSRHHYSPIKIVSTRRNLSDPSLIYMAAAAATGPSWSTSYDAPHSAMQNTVLISATRFIIYQRGCEIPSASNANLCHRAPPNSTVTIDNGIGDTNIHILKRLCVCVGAQRTHFV